MVESDLLIWHTSFSDQFSFTMYLFGLYIHFCSSTKMNFHFGSVFSFEDLDDFKWKCPLEDGRAKTNWLCLEFYFFQINYILSRALTLKATNETVQEYY